MNIIHKFIVQWEEARGVLHKVGIVNIVSLYTIFDYAADMFEQLGLVLVDHKEIDLKYMFDETNMSEWETIQDALDVMIEIPTEE